ncbi:MAG: DUF2971 domain-containing protein [Clostridiaceae bacterium]
MGFIEELYLITNHEELEKYMSVKEVGTIYHYTDVSGLKGILDEGNFRVSHSYFMNDKSEIMYTIDVVKTVLSELIVEETDDKVRELYDLLSKYAETYIKKEKGEAGIKLRSAEYRASEYILSFSLNGDSLNVWSSFTEGSGYNIGLDYKRFQQLLIDKSKRMSISSCVIYDVDKQHLIIKGKIQQYRNLVVRYKSDPFLNLEKVAERFFVSLRLFACFFKNPAFACDEEFRIVFFNYPKIIDSYIKPMYRAKNNLLIPYINILVNDNNHKISRLPVMSIRIGPTNFIDIAKEGISYYLYDFGYDFESIQVFNSKVPLRY